MSFVYRFKCLKFIIMICFTLVCIPATSLAAEEGIKVVVEKPVAVTINKKEIADGKLVNSKTYVPLQTFLETVGFEEIDWTPDDRTARIIHRGSKTIGMSFLIDVNVINLFFSPKKIVKNAHPEVMTMDAFKDINIGMVPLDDTPLLIEGQPYLPLRSFSELFGGEVQWDKTTTSATLNITVDQISELWESKLQNEPDDSKKDKE